MRARVREATTTHLQLKTNVRAHILSNCVKTYHELTGPKVPKLKRVDTPYIDEGQETSPLREPSSYKEQVAAATEAILLFSDGLAGVPGAEPKKGWKGSKLLLKKHGSTDSIEVMATYQIIPPVCPFGGVCI